jgi:arylsulfatase A-like enzyme
MNPYGKTFVLGLVAVSLSFADPSVIAGERPNVLYILADDIGWGDVGAYHEAQTGTAPVVPTPNLDALARDGMMFTDAHTPAALCAPTRFSLLTGSNPVRNGRPWGTWGLSSSSAFSAGGSHDTLGDVMQRADYVLVVGHDQHDVGRPAGCLRLGGAGGQETGKHRHHHGRVS